ncbi:MAG: sigma-70 family RNA polymerase sigma factor, partial [Coxiellaceae bacterium]|nr:sigma-70 family RNA polymerase sigma factor [Coxiellaceae bacterium]
TYHTMLSDIANGKILDLYDPNLEAETQLIDAESKTPQYEVQSKQFKERLAELLEHLPKKEQQLLSLYYFEEMNFKEIDALMNVSESRICQIHAQALTRLKSKFDL